MTTQVEKFNNQWRLCMISCALEYLHYSYSHTQAPNFYQFILPRKYDFDVAIHEIDGTASSWV